MADLIKAHEYKGFTIFQTQQEMILGGKQIPLGYVSATQILQAASAETGKRKAWDKYFNLENTQEFLEALSEENNQPILNNVDAPKCASAQPYGIEPLIIVIKGGHPEQQGTWTHLDVGLHLCQWASPKFAVWANKTLRLVLAQEFIPVTEAARQAEQKLNQYKESLFGKLSNSEYVELAVECHEELKALQFGIAR